MKVDHQSIYYPPGGILIWIVIYLELLTFGIAIIAMAYQGMFNRVEFHQSSELLNKTIATINTVLLLSSGFGVAKGVSYYKSNLTIKASRYFNFAILTGIAFLILKLIEYYEKLETGHSMGENDFFMFYWLLTGFHWIHVFIGVIILIFLRNSIIQQKEKSSFEDIEAGATFWHMCDLIWLLLLPILYLLF
ncbi:MAG: cytochrome c oxidase subunit 3 [Cytophagaceae bacterium]